MVQGSKITSNHVRQEMVKQSLTPTALDTNAWLALKGKKSDWLFQLLIILFI